MKYATSKETGVVMTNNNLVDQEISVIRGTGMLSVNTDPIATTLAIDGQMYPDITPTTIKNIPEGKHNVLLKLEGYKDFTGIIDVTEGFLCCMNVKMETVESAETSVSTKVCNPTRLSTTPISGFPDFVSLVAGIIIGIILAYLVRKFEKREGQK